MLILFVVINARDEALSPESQAFGAASEPGVADRENAFFAVLGFASPPGRDPHAQGVQAAARFEVAVVQRPYSVDKSALDSTDRFPVNPNRGARALEAAEK